MTNNEAQTSALVGDEQPPKGPEQPEVRLETDDSKPVNKRGRVVLIVLIIILIILLLLSCGILAKLLQPKGSDGDADTGGLTWVRSVYGWGSAESQLISPTSTDISADSNGFWVDDNDHFRLVEFDWNGKLKQVFDKDADGKAFDSPADMAVARDGWIYVTQSAYGNVLVFDANHKLQQTLQVPQPMSVDVNDDMAVIGARNGFVAFERDGTLIGSVGDFGHGDDEFDTINGIVLDDDSNAYVVDTYNNRLSKYDKQGDKVWMVGLGRPGNAGSDVRMEDQEDLKKKYPAMMQVPMGACIDSAGRILIIDSLDFSIAAFDPKDGKFIDKWGQYGSADGQLAYSSDIAYDASRDWFVVTDSGNSRAEIFKIPGSGGNLLSTIRQYLSGPLGACCIPILLIILFVILYTVWRWLKRRREKRLLEQENDHALEAVEAATGATAASAAGAKGAEDSLPKPPPSANGTPEPPTPSSEAPKGDTK